MERLLAAADRLERIVIATGRTGAWLGLVLVLVIVADVTLRRWFVIGSTQLQELEWHLHGALFLFALGYAYLKGAHVRIELFHDRFEPRTKAWVEFLGLLLALLPYCAAILWFGADYAGRAFAIDESSPSPTGLPHRWIIKSVLLAGFLILAAGGLARLIKAGLFLFGPADVREATGFAHGEAAASHLEEDRV